MRGAKAGMAILHALCNTDNPKRLPKIFLYEALSKDEAKASFGRL
jgi:hypothetical protein